MKKILIPIGTVLLSGLVAAQNQSSSTENYIYTKTYLDYDGAAATKVSETVQYFDGLGRPKQVVNVKASPLGKDVVTHIEYDGFGRQVRDYLPVPQQGTQNGGIYTSPLSNATQSNLYGSEKIYSEKILENSPLDRLLQQKQVGNAWDTKPVGFSYEANTAADAVKKYTTVTTWVDGATSSVLSQGTAYGASQLYKNTVTDEDGNVTVEFKNGQGQVVLVRKVLSATENADTYYVYNEYNQLAFVISPKASVESDPNAVLGDLCYQYKYDGRNRLVEKKVPGKGWEYMTYDKADRLIMTQDAELRKNSKWLITKYDKWGRTAYTGIIPGGSRSDMQSQSGAYIITENLDQGNPFTRNGMLIYYTNNLFYQIETVLSVNYYDSYLPGDPFPTMVYDQVVLPSNVQQYGVSTKGLPVSSFVKNIEDDNWTKKYMYYDLKGRLIREYSQNHLGGYTNIEKRLDFSGVPNIILTQHKRLATDTEKVITETFEYDSQNRLLVHRHKVDNNPVEILSQNTYNELLQLSNKKVGGTVASSPLQSIDYAYNIRGWMTKINDPVNLNGKLFGYELKYNNPVYTNIASGKYNGNIAEVDWKNASEDVLKRYTYAYDNLNRLRDAIYTEPQSTTPYNGNFNEILTYDPNGNIKTLKRNGFPVFGNTNTLVDDLEYHYTGNRLNQIMENSLNTTGYEGGNNIIDYDGNGNMITMKDKGIQTIRYNHLNLPVDFSISQPTIFGDYRNYNLSYAYRADGVKLRKSYWSPGRRGSTATVVITDYLDGFQYEYREDSGICMVCRTETAFEQQAYSTRKPFPGIEAPSWNLDFVPTAEGFYSYRENRYIYQYRDHLGNARISFSKNSTGALTVIDTNNYYPFGLNHIGSITSVSNFGGYYSYKYQGQELQETGFYSFKWRNYMPDVGRFFNIDPLATKYPYNSPYAFQENKVGMGVELEGLELLKNHTGFFAIHGGEMQVKRAPISQTRVGQDGNRYATFTAGDIGLSTSGYNPNGARISTGTTGLRQDSYKYDGPTPSGEKMESIRGNDRPTNIWTKTYDKGIDNAGKLSSGIKELYKLGDLAINIPDAMKSLKEYPQAINDVNAVKSQAMTMDQAIKYVDGSGIEMTQQTRNDVINYVNDGTLPNPGAGLMPNSLIIQNGDQIMKANGIQIQPLDQQLQTGNKTLHQ